MLQKNEAKVKSCGHVCRSSEEPPAFFKILHFGRWCWISNSCNFNATLTHYRLFYVPKGVFCRKSVFYLENNCHHMVMLHFLKTFHVLCETLHIRGYVVTAFSFFFKLKRVENGSFHNFVSVDVISDFHVLLFDIYIYRNVHVNSLQQPYDLAYMRYNSRDCVKY